MNEIIKRLEIWRLERGLDKSQGFEFDLKTQCSFLFEEIGVEYLRAKNNYEKIDALCDVSVFAINGLSLLDKGIVVLENCQIENSAICNACFMDILQDILLAMKPHSNPVGYFVDIIVCAKIIIEDMNYDYFKCMDETLKEIESRKGTLNPDTGKWEKFKDDESKKLWYKANYESCKL